MPNQLLPLGRFYLIECQSKTGPYLMECDDLPRGKNQTEDDALGLLVSFDDAIAVYEVFDGSFTDVSWQMAELWLKRLTTDFDPDAQEWPAFIQRHISPRLLDEAEDEIRAADKHQRDHVRSYSIPA